MVAQTVEQELEQAQRGLAGIICQSEVGQADLLRLSAIAPETLAQCAGTARQAAAHWAGGQVQLLYSVAYLLDGLSGELKERSQGGHGNSNGPYLLSRDQSRQFRYAEELLAALRSATAQDPAELLKPNAGALHSSEYIPGGAQLSTDTSRKYAESLSEQYQNIPESQ